MTAIVLDAGALIALDRGDRSVIALLEAAELDSIDVRTTAVVVAQVWRDGSGRQARLARALRGIEVVPVDEQLARDAGVLLGVAGTTDVIDATVVLVADDRDTVLTSDPHDIERLTTAVGRRLRIVQT